MSLCVVFYGESAGDIHLCVAPQISFENSEQLFFPDQQIQKKNPEVDKSNVGDRLKRVLPKFEGWKASV